MGQCSAHFCISGTVLADIDFPQATQRSFLYEMKAKYFGADNDVPFDQKLFE
jgi:hypothetical protein